MTIFINPYNRGSRGAFSLKEALVGKGNKVIVSGRRPKFKTPLVVSWGNSDFEYPTDGLLNVVNNPQVIPYLSNKLRFFNAVGHSEMVPAWTTDPAEALAWQSRIFVRHRLEASGGAGIEVVEGKGLEGINLPRAPLYVRHFSKTHEFRVHVARSLLRDDFAPILVQRKIFQKTEENPAPKDWNVRNHQNGFIFVRNSGYPTPPEVNQVAVDLMRQHFPELHFAALDVLYHEKARKAVVIEGNTAPGLEGNTVQVYADYIHRLARERQRAA